MRTLIRGGWVVGNSGATHTLIRDGVVVYEDETIVHVGAEFDGQVDREIDASSKLVSPGFIDTHIHSGHRAADRLITDAGRPEYFGQPFFETLPDGAHPWSHITPGMARDRLRGILSRLKSQRQRSMALKISDVGTPRWASPCQCEPSYVTHLHRT